MSPKIQLFFKLKLKTMLKKKKKNLNQSILFHSIINHFETSYFKILKFDLNVRLDAKTKNKNNKNKSLNDCNGYIIRSQSEGFISYYFSSSSICKITDSVNLKDI